MGDTHLRGLQTQPGVDQRELTELSFQHLCLKSAVIHGKDAEGFPPLPRGKTSSTREYQRDVTWGKATRQVSHLYYWAANCVKHRVTNCPSSVGTAGSPGQGVSRFKPENSWASWSPSLFSHSVVSDSLWPHRLQHARLPCPSLPPPVLPTCPIYLPCPSLPPRVCTNSCPLGQWCHPTFSFCLQSFPASGSSKATLFPLLHNGGSLCHNINVILNRMRKMLPFQDEENQPQRC